MEKLKQHHHVSVFTITIEDPETKQAHHVWDKYVIGEFSIAAKVQDKHMEKALLQLKEVGSKVLKSGVTCCLPARCYDKSVIEKLKNSKEGYFFETHLVAIPAEVL
jgi:hypothetical protein